MTEKLSSGKKPSLRVVHTNPSLHWSSDETVVSTQMTYEDIDCEGHFYSGVPFLTRKISFLVMTQLGPNLLEQTAFYTKYPYDGEELSFEESTLRMSVVGLKMKIFGFIAPFLYSDIYTRTDEQEADLFALGYDTVRISQLAESLEKYRQKNDATK